jgi:hypothetical protein
MKTVTDKIGDTMVLIQVMEEPVEIVGEAEQGRATELTGIDDRLKDAYSKVKTLITDIADDIGTELKTINSAARPKQIEMEMNIGISAQFGPVCLLSAKGDYAIKVKMIWELTSNASTNQSAN